MADDWSLLFCLLGMILSLSMLCSVHETLGCFGLWVPVDLVRVWGVPGWWGGGGNQAGIQRLNPVHYGGWNRVPRYKIKAMHGISAQDLGT